jgi:thioredoxin-related protein
MTPHPTPATSAGASAGMRRAHEHVRTAAPALEENGGFAVRAARAAYPWCAGPPDGSSTSLEPSSMRLLNSSARLLRLSALAAALATSLATPLAHAADGAPSPNVAWQEATSDADIDKAFATARAEHKPVLLYWGAVWCPPCNQLKATLFNRQDFAEQSKSFVAVHLDGDAPGAQKLGTKFKVVGYPTLILFNTDRKEITRLPGEVDASQVMQLLRLGMASGGRPFTQVVADARAGKPLTGSEWRLLAFYSWDTDEGAGELAAADRGPLLRKLAASCPSSEAEACARLALKSIADHDEKNAPAPDAATRARVAQVLADPVQSRAYMDVLVNYAGDLATALAPKPGADRDKLVASLNAALVRLQADTTLSRGDRLTALFARVDLARLDQPKDTLHPKLPPALVKEVRDVAAATDREATSAFERQATIPTAAQLLEEAGLWKESEALLKSSVAKSHAPYYLMIELGGNARKQGRNAEALGWYQQAFDKSEGPATRLQWGTAYLSALVDLAPQDSKRIEATAKAVFTEAAAQPNAFYERNGRSLQKLGAKLVKWNEGGKHQAVIDHLNSQLQGVCAKLPAGDPQHATCEGVFKPAPAAKA